MVARERDDTQHANFCYFITQFDKQQLLFIDESSKDDRTFQVSSDICVLQQAMRLAEAKTATFCFYLLLLQKQNLLLWVVRFVKVVRAVRVVRVVRIVRLVRVVTVVRVVRVVILSIN